MKTLDHEPAIRPDPRRMSGVQLARLGVRILNRYDLALQCMICSETWTPLTGRDGKLPPGYWHCPNKCNL
jgi:hypothetical protein